jgi:hypothetical protein
MKASASTLAAGLLLSVALPVNVVLASDPGDQIILERANYWRAQHRPDLAGQILGKLLATNPGQPDALYQQGMLAIEQGDSGSAQQYLDRLRQVAPADERVTELAAKLAQPVAVPPAKPMSATGAATNPAPITVTVTATRVAELAARLAKPSAVPAAEPVSVAGAAANPAPTTVAVTAPQPPVSTTPASATPASVVQPVKASPIVAASADSDDLAPARPAATPRPAAQPVAHYVAGATPASKAPPSPAASLPQPTISDASDAPIPLTASAARPAGSADLGITAKAVQIAQVELEAPPPVSGYQPLAALRPYSPDDTLEMYIDRDLQQLEAQANPTLIAGLGYRTHNGNDGTEHLDEVGAPIQTSFSPWYTGIASVAVLPVYLDAGSLSTGNLNTFGTNPLASAAGLPGIKPGDQNAGGVGLLGSYTWTDFSGQIGTTPLGFPVTNIVGTVSYTPKFLDGNLAVRFEGSRQPVTDTVLSYAGTHASFASTNVVAPGSFGTNTLWGGVVRTGGHVIAFYDDQSIGAYGGAGAAWLTGTNVAQNAAVDALLGAYFRPFKTDNWTLRVGVSGYYEGFDKNLSGFTFGQGGYFSPQNFEGIGFPIEFTGRTGPWSYLAAATLGVQHFNESSSPVFPNNPNAQLVLQSLSPSTAFLSGVNGGWGFGANLKGQLEYAIDPSLSVGIAGSYNNGNDYDEYIAQIYLRKTFDWFAPLASKNDPQSIAARDQPMSRL